MSARNEKICIKCKQMKPLKSFNKNRTKSDGLQNHCVSCHRRYKRKYRETTKGFTVARTATRKYDKQNPHRRAARNILADAVRYGKIIKPETCSDCNAKGLIDGHHEDYSQPLKVVWLCRACHKQLHRKGVAA